MTQTPWMAKWVPKVDSLGMQERIHSVHPLALYSHLHFNSYGKSH